MSVLVTWIVLLFLSGAGGQSEREIQRREAAQGVLIPRLGVAAELSGRGVVTDSEIIVSVVMVFPNVTEFLENRVIDPAVSSDLRWCRGARTLASTIDNGDYYPFNTTYVRIVNVFSEKSAEFVASRNNILKQYITKVHDTKRREKRDFISGLLGGGLVSLLLGGISEVQILKLKSHVQSNAEDIEMLKTELLKTRVENRLNEIRVENEVVGIKKAIKKTVRYLYKENKCEQLINSVALAIRDIFEEKKQIIDDILWTALSGSNQLLLTPRMIELEVLKNIVKQMSQFDTTVYKQNPEFRYSLAQMALIEVDSELTQAHFALIMPKISEYDLRNIYVMKQVQPVLDRDRNICAKVKIDTHVVEVNNTWYPIALDKWIETRKRNQYETLTATRLALFLLSFELLPPPQEDVSLSAEEKRSLKKSWRAEFRDRLEGTIVRPLYMGKESSFLSVMQLADCCTIPRAIVESIQNSIRDAVEELLDRILGVDMETNGSAVAVAIYGMRMEMALQFSSEDFASVRPNRKSPQDTKESARRLCVSRLQEGVRSALHASKQLLEERMTVREAIEHIGCHSAAAYNMDRPI
eukprot:sb/3463350/